MSGLNVFKMSRRAAVAVSVALAMLLPMGAAQAKSVEQVKSAGTIKIGIQADNCPWGCINSSGSADGFDADLGRAFAKYLGVTPEFVPLAVANRIPALTTQKVEVLIACMGMTAERAKSVQFSQPYAGNMLMIVGPVDMDLMSAEKLKGHSIGVPRAAAQDTALTKVAPEGTNIMRFDDDAANIQALLSGQIDAVGANMFYINRINAAAPGKYKNQLVLQTLYNGAATRLGEADWNTAFNTFFDQYKTTDEYKALYKKWLGSDPVELPKTLENIPFTAAK